MPTQLKTAPLVDTCAPERDSGRVTERVTGALETVERSHGILHRRITRWIRWGEDQRQLASHRPVGSPTRIAARRVDVYTRNGVSEMAYIRSGLRGVRWVA